VREKREKKHQLKLDPDPFLPIFATWIERGFSMANTKISQAYSKSTLETTDMIPVAKQGALTAYHVTGQTLFDSLPPASTASKGVVELATAAEARAGSDTERALTPASLANAIGPTMVAAGILYIGQVSALTAAAISAQFATAIGRAVAHGDVMIFDDASSGYYVGFFHSGAGKVYGFNLRTGDYVSYA
jgi:hypothetical protein